MTTLAYDPSDHYASLLWGWNESGAGPLARKVSRSLENARTWLLGDAEGLAYSLDDLDNLASELGLAVHVGTIALGRMFLHALPGDIPPPDIDLDQDGDLVFDWRGPTGAMLTICLSRDGHLNYAARLSDRQTRNGQDVFNDAIPADLVRLARQVNKSR